MLATSDDDTRDQPGPARGSAAATPFFVLVVDDDADSREALVALLADAGAEVEAATTVAEALACYEARTHDLVISDISMPDADGYALIRRVRELEGGQRRTVAIALSGFASDEDREAVLRAGYDEHLAKPVDPAALVDRVRALATARVS